VIDGWEKDTFLRRNYYWNLLDTDKLGWQIFGNRKSNIEAITKQALKRNRSEKNLRLLFFWQLEKITNRGCVGEVGHSVTISAKLAKNSHWKKFW
jgi:hypothetical protein